VRLWILPEFTIEPEAALLKGSDKDEQKIVKKRRKKNFRLKRVIDYLTSNILRACTNCGVLRR